MKNQISFQNKIIIMKKLKSYDKFSNLNESYGNYKKAVQLLQKMAEIDTDGNLKVCNKDKKKLVDEINGFLKNIL